MKAKIKAEGIEYDVDIDISNNTIKTARSVLYPLCNSRIEEMPFDIAILSTSYDPMPQGLEKQSLHLTPFSLEKDVVQFEVIGDATFNPETEDWDVPAKLVEYNGRKVKKVTKKGKIIYAD